MCKRLRQFSRIRGRAISSWMLHPEDCCPGEARHRNQEYHDRPPIRSASLRIEKEVVNRGSRGERSVRHDGTEY
jgi:hypothetical protein